MVDPPLGIGAPDVITGRTLPQTTTALQERRFIGGQDANGIASWSAAILTVAPCESMFLAAARLSRWRRIRPTTTNSSTTAAAGPLGDTASNEIERATAGEPHPVTYYHNALANTADALVRMRAVERHVDYLDNLTHRPEWQLYATRSAEQARRRSAGRPPREKWEQPKLPQLRDGAQRQGWYMDNRMDDVFSSRWPKIRRSGELTRSGSRC